VGPAVSESERGESVPVRDLLVGPRVASPTGPNRVPGVQLYIYFVFFFFFSVFLISFITFAIVTQMTSNQLQKFSKNKVNILKQ
jgi:hypothetical protein